MTASVTFTGTFVTRDGSSTREATVTQAVVGGWTGRDRHALQHHIDELARIGVKPPVRTPLFYRVSVTRLNWQDEIQVIGDGSSGEVEYVMLRLDGRIWVGVGSDHTDRAIEHAGITVAKQVCDKPIGATFWPMDEVSPHWDRLTLRSWITENGARVLYQDGSVGGLLSPDELLAAYAAEGKELAEGMLMFGGTCGAIGGVRHAPTFEVELADPVLGRSIRHAYRLTPLEILG